MPLGYPSQHYNFSYSPYETQLPFPHKSKITFIKAIENKKRYAYLEGNLNISQVSQLLWASYGYSYLFDNTAGWRHRTVLSSHATYPFRYANLTTLYHYKH